MGIVIVNVKPSAGGARPLGGPGACPPGKFPNLWSPEMASP